MAVKKNYDKPRNSRRKITFNKVTHMLIINEVIFLRRIAV
jgi:hypothetical protein